MCYHLFFYCNHVIFKILISLFNKIIKTYLLFFILLITVNLFDKNILKVCAQRKINNPLIDSIPNK